MARHGRDMTTGSIPRQLITFALRCWPARPSRPRMASSTASGWGSTWGRAPSAPCPPTPGVTTDQLNVTGCTADQLSTTNANDGRPRELRYQLNFIASDGSRSTCDPIIDNGGGTHK
jgi:hypothetical protein